MAVMGIIKGCTGGSSSEHTEVYSSDTTLINAGTPVTINGLTAGKHYIVYAFTFAGSTLTYNRYDATTISGATSSIFTHLFTVNYPSTGTFWDVVPSGTSITVTLNEIGLLRVYE